jgi:amino-acid N-acetyltransferase
MASTLREARPDDWAAIRALLERAGLPLAGAEDHLDGFIVALEGDRLTGTAALERHGADALLRSVAVAPERQGTGLGQTLVREALSRARRSGVRSVTLLTTTAGGFFPRFGFARCTRDDVPEAVRQSAEFTGACPSSATVMKLDLGVRS